MKKISLLLFLIGFLNISCDLQSDYHYYFEIINESSENVSFDFNGIQNTVNADETLNLDEAHYTALTNITADGYGIRVKGTYKYTNNYSTITYTFFDIEPYKLNVFNTLPVEFKIKAGEYIYYLESTELTVPANDPPNTDGIIEDEDIYIYTNRPIFSIVQPEDPNDHYLFPVIFDWEIVDKIDIDTQIVKEYIMLVIR